MRSGVRFTSSVLFDLMKHASMHCSISLLMAMHLLEQRDFRVFSCRRPFTTFIASPYCLSLMVKAPLAGSSHGSKEKKLVGVKLLWKLLEMFKIIIVYKEQEDADL